MINRLTILYSAFIGLISWTIRSQPSNASFQLSESMVEIGTDFTVNLTAKDFQAATSFFLSFTFNPSVISLNGVDFTDVNIGLKHDDINEFEKGRIHLVWNTNDEINGTSFDEKVIAIFSFKAIGMPGSSTILSFEDNAETDQRIELYSFLNNKFINSVPQLINGSAIVTDEIEPDAGIFYFEKGQFQDGIVSIDLKAKNFTNIGSFFISFTWNHEEVEFLDIIDIGVVDNDQIRVNTSIPNRGVVSWSSNDSEGTDFDDIILKRLRFRTSDDLLCPTLILSLNNIEENNQNLEVWQIRQGLSSQIFPSFVNGHFSFISEFSLGQERFLCPNESLMLVANEPGEISWFFNNILIAEDSHEVKISRPGIYRVEIKQEICVITDQVKVLLHANEVEGLTSDIQAVQGQQFDLPVLSGGVSYTWSTSSSIELSCNDCPNPVGIADSSGFISVTIRSEDDCLFSSSAVVETEPLNRLTAFSPFRNPSCTNINDGYIELLIRGGQPPYNVLWNDGNTNIVRSEVYEGLYSVLITDQSAQSIELQILTESQEPPQIETLVTDATCSLSNSLEVQITNGVTVDDIVWQSDELSGFLNSNVKPGVYLFEIVDNFGCSIIDSVEIDDRETSLLLDLGSDIKVCDTENAPTLDVPSEFISSQITWLLNTLPISSEVNIELNEPGEYILNIDSQGCLLSDTVFVTFPVAILNFPDTIFAREGEESTIELDLPTFFQIEWEFPVGYETSCNDCNTPSFTPNRAQFVEVKVTDTLECIYKHTFFIQVESGDLVDAINFLSPNGDGYNDKLEFDKLVNFENASISVLNKWGRILFTIENYQNDWNGEYKGSSLPDGVYYYILQFEDQSEKYTISSDLLIINGK